MSLIGDVCPIRGREATRGDRTAHGQPPLDQGRRRGLSARAVPTVSARDTPRTLQDAPRSVRGTAEHPFPTSRGQAAGEPPGRCCEAPSASTPHLYRALVRRCTTIGKGPAAQCGVVRQRTTASRSYRTVRRPPLRCAGPVPSSVPRDAGPGGLPHGQMAAARTPLGGAVVTDERLRRVSETPMNTLQYRFDGPEDAPVLILGPSPGTTWLMS